MLRGPAQDPGRARERPDGFIFAGPVIHEFAGWPRPVLTDGEGRFAVRGVGREVRGTLGVHHPRFAPEIISFDEAEASESKPLTLALAPAQILNVRVTYADTGEPVPHAPLEVMASRGRAGRHAPFDRMVGAGQPGGRRIYSHALLALDLKPGTVSQDVNVSLRRGATVKGQVTGPDGQSVPNAYLFSRVILDPSGGIWRRWTGRPSTRVRSGRFEIHGLEPDTEVPVYFLDPKRKLGTMVKFSGKSAPGEPINVRLEACGIARARLVDPAGRPFAGRLPRGELRLTMVVSPGPLLSSSRNEPGVLAADEGGMSIIDPVNYGSGLASDAAGQITFPALIPGATYRLIEYSASRQAEPQIRKSFTVTAGENLDLGDILIEKPSG